MQTLEQLLQQVTYVSPTPVTSDSIDMWLSVNIPSLSSMVIGDFVIGDFEDSNDNKLNFIASVIDGVVSVRVSDEGNNVIDEFTCNEELSIVNSLQSY